MVLHFCKFVELRKSSDHPRTIPCIKFMYCRVHQNEVFHEIWHTGVHNVLGTPKQLTRRRGLRRIRQYQDRLSVVNIFTKEAKI